MSTTERLQVLQEKWTGCTKCKLHKIRARDDIVFGRGRVHADFLIIIDAPSAVDALTGSPLGGERGEVFSQVYSAAGLDPKDAYRTSLVACRPYVVIPATEEEEEREQDRLPEKEEIEACLPRLHETIYQVDPRLIFAVGDKTFKALVATSDRGRDATTITKAHGNLYVTHVPGRLRTVRYPVMALVPPQQLINNPSAAKHGPIATTTNALHKAARYVSWLKRNEKKDTE